jgi:hypothetical protein
MAGFGISGVEPSGSATRELVSKTGLSNTPVTKNKPKRLYQ